MEENVLHLQNSVILLRPLCINFVFCVFRTKCQTEDRVTIKLFSTGSKFFKRAQLFCIEIHINIMWTVSRYVSYRELSVLWHVPINSSPPGQNGRYFVDNILRCIFVNEKFCILIKISLKFVPKCPIDNNPALVEVMAWRQATIWTNTDPFNWRIYVALGGDELRCII